ncbi:MAG: T9SS type A sorting domain-containing protein [Cytophagales bacterium]|nr:T9SS type A sorting domain-containing protein [Cytophagales bacterium]
MKKALFLSLVLAAQMATAQIVIKPIVGNYNAARIGQLQVLPAVSLPFWDDFSYSGDKPDSLWEFSNSIFVNEAIAIDPPTFKAATFDGLDSLGHLYDANAEFPGLSDQLISRRIKLVGLIGDESIYLSFFWEAGGNGEAPEDSDSLRLQFLNADSVWVTEWKMRADNAPSTNEFTQVILKVNPEYRHDDFRFKFESFGSLQGPFDTWHVDYVYLNMNRQPDGLFYDDQAYTGSLSSIIAPYREMPSKHFFEDPTKYLVPQNFQIFNLDAVDLDGYEADYSLRILGEKGVELETVSFIDGSIIFQGNQTINSETLDSNDDATGSSQEDSPVSISAISPAPDSVVLSITLTSNFTDIYRINDTIRASYTFQNYYAYDDGVAEFAGGIPQDKGSMAVLYALETRDTLSHVDIYFPSIIPSSEGRSINVNLWKNLDGSDPIASVSYTIQEKNRDEFSRIQFSQPIIVEDTIYVGFTQNTSDYVGVGIDRSNLLAKDLAFYKSSDEWETNSLANGVFMIRPVFAPEDYVVGVENQKTEFSFYPNPTTGHLTIPNAHAGIQILSLDGKIQFEDSSKTSYNVGYLKTGIYLLRILDQEQAIRTFKLIKE